MSERKDPILDGVLPGEEILPFHYPIHGDYFYVCDGEVHRCPFFGEDCIIANWKQSDGFKEIRNCDAAARNLLPYLV